MNIKKNMEQNGNISGKLIMNAAFVAPHYYSISLPYLNTSRTIMVKPKSKTTSICTFTSQKTQAMTVNAAHVKKTEQIKKT